MTIFILILIIGSIAMWIRAIALSYSKMPVGGTIVDLFKQLHWINYIPVINFLLFIAYYIMVFFKMKIK